MSNEKIKNKLVNSMKMTKAGTAKTTTATEKSTRRINRCIKGDGNFCVAEITHINSILTADSAACSIFTGKYSNMLGGMANGTATSRYAE